MRNISASILLICSALFSSHAYSQTSSGLTITEYPNGSTTASESDNNEDNVSSVRKISVKDFFKNADKTMYKISPNGKMYSFLSSYKKRFNVFIQPTDLKTEAKRITKVTDKSIGKYFWKNDTKIIYIKDFNGDENYHIFVIDINTLEEKDLTQYEGVQCDVLDSLDYVCDDEILITMNKEQKKLFDVYRLNIKTGDLKLVAKNPGGVTDWLADHEGKVRMGTAYDGVNTSVYYREKEEDGFKQIMTMNFKDSFKPLFFTSDNKDVYALSNIGRDKTALVKYTISDSKEDIIFQHADVDISGASYSPKTKALLSVKYQTWNRVELFFDKKLDAMHSDIISKLDPEMEIQLDANDKEERVYIVKSNIDKGSDSYYLYDTQTKILKKLCDASPWLDPNSMSRMKPIQYTSRDGLTINGYLTLPAGKEPKNIPVVVSVHGGPWDRNNWGFKPEVQFLANRGYAVLQINFRGSTGYGKEFWESSFKQWGLKMQDDITDGVQWLIDQGIADPKKIAIYGKSYGGYATLAGLAFTPDLYACGIDAFGPSNLFTLIASIPDYWEPLREMLYEQIGDPEKDKELLTKVSPVFHTDQMKAPLLVAQGANDPRVKENEAEQIVDALRERGMKVKFMLKKNEGHGFLNEEDKIEFYEKMDKFLAKCIGSKSK